MGAMQMLYVLYLSKSKKGANSIPEGTSASRQQRIKWILDGIPTLMLPLIIIVGICGGIVTPTESSVLAVLYAMFLVVITRELA